MASYTAPPILVTAPRRDGRAEFIFGGIEQAGPSFEGRVFLNNPEADERTSLTPDSGYAGSFHVYGYGGTAPQAVAEAKAARAEGGPVAPIEKRLHADEEAVRAALDGSDELTVTVIPVPADPGGTVPGRPFEHVDIVFNRGTTEP